MSANLFQIFLALHVAGGTVALVVAPLAMATVKGGYWHRFWGKFYFWAMAEVAVTATVMCRLRSGLFLFLIAVFSFYLAFTGYRVLKLKSPAQRPGWPDLGVAAAMILAGLGLVFLGLRDANPAQRWVRIIFGGIGLFLGTVDAVGYFKPPPGKQAWLITHLTRFLAAYIATVTAFSVVNFKFLPEFWRWLWPTVIGAAGITICRIHYRRKWARRTTPVQSGG